MAPDWELASTRSSSAGIGSTNVSKLQVLRADDGVELALHLFEFSRDGPVFLWAHANGFCTQSYRPLLDALSSSMRVVGLDLRAHGFSAQPAPPYEESLATSRLAADYLLALEWVRLAYPGKPVIGAGHSMGALLPLMAAMQKQALDRLVLIEAAIFPPPGNAARVEAQALTADRQEKIARRRSVFGDPEELKRTLERMPAFAPVTAGHLMQHCRSVLRQIDESSYELRCAPAAESFLYGEVARFDKYTDLLDLRMPVLLVGADPDHSGSSWASRIQGYLHEVIAGSHLEVLADVGHLAPLQAPYAIAKSIERWVQP